MLVKRVFANGKKMNTAYKLKDAMKDAKKLYRGTTSKVSKVAKSVVRTAKRAATGKIRGGKSRRNTTSRKH